MVSVVAQFSRKLVCEQKCTPEENYTQMNQPDQHHSPMAQGAGPYDRGGTSATPPPREALCDTALRLGFGNRQLGVCGFYRLY